MNRNCLLNKALALLLCAVLLIGYLPVSALPVAATTSGDQWESEKDVLEEETTTEAPTEPEAEEIVKTITFDDTSKRTVLTTEQQVWVENGITVTNDKGSSTSNVADYSSPARFYKSSTVTIACAGMTKIEWVANAAKYATALQNSISDDNATVTVSGTVVTIEFATAVDSFSVTLSDGQVRTDSMTVYAVASGNTEPEATVPETEPTPGSDEMNAIYLGEMENTVTNAGSLWYMGYFSGTVMTVTGEGDFSVTYGGEDVPAVEGAVSIPVASANPRMPVTFVLNGDGEYTISFAYPEGSQMNPAELVLGYNDTAIEAGNTQGYYYKWTATETGTLSFNIETITEGVEADIVINNNTTYANRTLLADGVENDFGVMVVSMPVTAGDEIEVQIAVMPDANWAYPAADINHYSEFTYPVGSEMNPVLLLETANMVTNVGTTYYSGYFSGMSMTVAGEGEFSVIYNGETLPSEDGCVWTLVSSPNPRMPVTFAIVGDGDYTITFDYPVGTQMNPAVADNYNCATIEAGNTQGYYFTYTAEYTGNLIVEIFAQTGWTYVINNMTTYAYGDTQCSDSDPVVNPAVVAVTEGDEIQIIVNTYDPADMWNNPAGDITVYLSYEPGTCEEFRYVLDQNVQTVTNAGTKYYLARHSGCMMIISGEGDFSITYNGEVLSSVYGFISTEVYSANPFFNPVVFELTGDGDYTIEFIYPAGHANNPATAFLGDNVAQIEAGGSEYYFNYTAEYTGDLTVGISSGDGNWQYTINNLTTYAYGDTQLSDSDPVVNPATVAVTEGDVIEIKVITYDPETPWVAPAGDITVNLAYEPEIALAKPGLRLALESDLSAGFTVKPEMFADGAYTDLRMEFRLGDENATPVVVTDYITLSNGDRVYMFDGIAPRMLNETIYVKLYGTHKGTEYSVEASTSIYDYCNWALSGSNAKLKTLVVDLMNYASAHQIYGNYKTDTLANRNLTPEQQALGTQADPARTNITNASQAVIANPTASFTGAALYLQNKVEIRFTFSVPELTENTRLVVMVDGETVSYGADKFVANGSKYYVDVDALAAKQMRSAVDATLYEGDTAISNTLRYSIESFVAWAYGRENFSSEALDAMMITMLKYGDSANAFFN